ncbi:DNA recombination protein RmuC [Methylacidimicrobium cyclopophantes]|uniref:DNA recombination protein RmuC n=1 Tax=Methylacidimicrobium cyclopophantes TaxID=1041766 RepID=A0A5E6ME45_9BACT|nr:DNA recombination protein RmuC [Methylacidimicrobium cyclopophantes]VVM07833.1 DNA recombination protein RmuC [Methylacidimicrobium cyclopophantes]
MELWVIGLAGVAAGVTIVWLFWRGDRAALRAQLEESENARSRLETELAENRRTREEAMAALRMETERRAAAEEKARRLPTLEADLQESRRELGEIRTRFAELSSRLVESEKAAKEKLLLLEEARTRFAEAFRGLSAEALRQNNEAFLSLARENFAQIQEGAKAELEARKQAVEALTQPIRESLQKVDGKLGEIERSRIGAYSALHEQLKALVETHLPQLRSETASLVKALRQPVVRGRWGEMQLRRVVEMAGMVEHCDFFEQASFEGEEGRLRPDLIVQLPGGKQIVIDAKAPIAAYLEALEASDEPTQIAKLADHARQVREHMAALGKKAYWEGLASTPEFVILFLPGEMFFSAALQQDPGLLDYGVQKRVIPATPTTLIALLQAVAYGWQQEALTENAREISELGRTLYKRLATLADHWTGVGKGIEQAIKAYNKATAALESRVLVSARRFTALQAAPEGETIETPEPIDHSARLLQAPEMLSETPEPNGEE